MISKPKRCILNLVLNFSDTIVKVIEKFAKKKISFTKL